MITRLLNLSLTVRQLISLAVIGAVVAGIPYFGIGIFWALTRRDHLATLSGLERLFSTLGEVVAWPVLLIADVTLK